MNINFHPDADHFKNILMVIFLYGKLLFNLNL